MDFTEYPITAGADTGSGYIRNKYRIAPRGNPFTARSLHAVGSIDNDGESQLFEDGD